MRVVHFLCGIIILITKGDPMSRAEKKLAELKAKEELKKLKAERREQYKKAHQDKAWYQYGWGLVVAILFFPYFIVWYAWAKSKWGKGIKIAVTAVVAIVMLPIIIGIATTDTTQQNADANKEQTPTSQQQGTTTPAPEPVNTTPAEPSKPVETVSQRNAIRSAKSYLGYTAFSHDGLVAQLEYEKFSHEDAVYGADNSGGDWMEQAAKSAKSYMDYSSFSREGLIGQLEHEKFTPEQAAHGADSVGL